LAKQHALKKKDIPSTWSIESADFINKLIQRQPSARLGNKSGVEELKQHPWFVKYPWKQLEDKKLVSPFKTKYMGPHATDRQEEYD
jgi:serum/glucocorticoid-regulated kinase 2